MGNSSLSVSNQILNHRQITQKVRRMAFELYEQNYNAEGLVLAGINGMGARLSDLLAAELQNFSTLRIEQIEVEIDKQSPSQEDIKVNSEGVELNDKVVVLVDDVLYTGRTIAYGMKPFLQKKIKKLQLAVLIDRSHRSFPVSPDVVGYELSTTINQRIEVKLADSENFGVYLF